MALVLSPEPPLGDWLRALDIQIAKSASFFEAKPVILDLGLVVPEEDGLAELVPALAARGVRLVGIEGADESWDATRDWDWPQTFSGGRAIGPVEVPEQELPQPPAATSHTLLVEEPVRSGQSISHPDGDVVVMGSVASGSEVSAGGSIHVYGTLRGRALAGIGGNGDARILCRRMNAELIAIDGFYMTAEDMPADRVGRSVQAKLDGESLVLLPLD
ncbi:septum site-determining protein MinC [Acetobacteraceae bacterium KSS12]|uniref:Probable septum site-determining protein MinC n=2 Tax=Rhizosaccharibacter radicis TaxID=2782605 RepID=A0ABT1VVE8_9PROT|nr:septum site-determining protein MinC [Acetobacteraceae bacterium KSS12]